MREFRNCRFCGELAGSDELVKYGVRHYAHFACYLERRGGLAGLSAYQVGRFPYELLRQHLLLEEAEQIRALAQLDQERRASRYV